MKARFRNSLISIVASLLLGSLGGCSSAPGQNALAVRLSAMKTFGIYGSKDAKGLHPLTDGPVPEAVTQALREGLESRGYRYQDDAPDFYVVVTWQKSLQPEQQSSAPAVDAREVPPVSPAFAPEFNSVTLNLVVRTRLTDQVLWWSPVTKAAEAQNIKEAMVRNLMQEILKDFPPAQG
jgi:hypothetical protein